MMVLDVGMVGLVLWWENKKDFGGGVKRSNKIEGVRRREILCSARQETRNNGRRGTK